MCFHFKWSTTEIIPNIYKIRIFFIFANHLNIYILNALIFLQIFKNDPVKRILKTGFAISSSDIHREETSGK